MQTKDENLQDYSPIPEIWNYAMVQQDFSPGFYINRYNNVVSSMASKPIISDGLEPVLRYAEKACIASDYRQLNILGMQLRQKKKLEVKN